MAIFKYTLPSGAKYTVQAPDGYTQAQADRAFYEQVAAGSLVGYRNGQTLASAATRLANFGLSRLQRGTAGVDINTVLAIVFESPIIAPVPPLTNVPIVNPVSASAILNTGPVDAFTPIGPLGPSEVRALIAQIGELTDSPADAVTSNGVGKYLLTPNALEKAGYVKPGTSNYPNVQCALQSPSVWTGKDGITELGLLLDDPVKQAQVQNEVMISSYNNLTAAGLIQDPPKPRAPVTSGQIYSSTGQLTTITAATLLAGTAAINGSLSLAVKDIVGTANSAITTVKSFVTEPIRNITTLASGAVNTVTQEINNLKEQAIKTANGIINTVVAPVNTVIQTVAGVGTTLTTAGTQLTNLGTTIANFDLAKTASGLTTTISGDVGALVTNVSKFGTDVTTAWATGTSSLTGAAGDAAKAVTGALGEASSVVTSAAGEASTLVSSAVGEATTLVNGSISEITGTLTSGALGDASTYVQSSLATLSESAGATLTQLGGSLDIFAKMSQFSIGDALGLLSSDTLVSAVVPAPGFSNTVQRDTVDAAVSRIIGNPKIPTPSFEYPSVASAATKLDIAQAQSIIKNLTSQTTTLVNRIVPI